MARSPSRDRPPGVAQADAPLDGPARNRLIAIADGAITDGLAGRTVEPIRPADLPESLLRPAASFVTLHVRGELNGCIGSIEASGPLAGEVARHAWSAAFDDPRLPALHPDDYEHLAIEVSILSVLDPIPAGRRDVLLPELRPGVDGLLIESASRRAVFLPSVWASLPDAAGFVDQLFVKAGLDPVAWPDNLLAWRFTAEKIEDRR